MSRRASRSIVAVNILLAVVLLVACSPSTPGNPGSISNTAFQPDELLRIATYNINFANKDLSLVEKAILESGAGIIALQETTSFSARYLIERLKNKFPHTTLSGRRDPHHPVRVGFISKYPILRSEYFKPKYGFHGKCCSVFEVGKKRIQVVNVHLHPLPVFAVRGPIECIRMLREAERIHKAEIERIHRKLIPDIPTIILGDFNSLSEFKAPTYLKDNGFTDSFASVHEDPDKHRTWEWQTRYGKVSARIDYIFHDASFKTLDSRIIRNESSDHSLLVSELRSVEESE